MMETCFGVEIIYQAHADSEQEIREWRRPLLLLSVHLSFGGVLTAEREWAGRRASA